MMNMQAACFVNAAYGKGWAGHCFKTAEASCQSPCKGCFAAAQITDKLKNLAAAKLAGELLGELLGTVGTGGFYLPRHVGTHMLHIVARILL